MGKGTKKHLVYKSAKDMPPMAASSYDMSYNKTGVWRSIRPVIDYDKCIYCSTCWKFCPEPAIHLESIEIKNKEKQKPVIDYDYCKGCGICWSECPTDAIAIEEEER